MPSAKTPTVDPATGKIWDDLIPGTFPTVAEVAAQISAALVGFTPSGGATDLTGTPLYWYAVNGAYPGRPVTPRPVIWKSWDVLPPAPGSTTSGTGPAPIDTVELRAGVGVVTV